MIYLDNAATTPIDERVLEEMIPFMKSSFGNAGSPHKLGVEARRAVEQARIRVASFINALPEQVIFTSGGSESNTLAIVGAIPYIAERCKIGAPAIAISPLEHDSVATAANCVFDRTQCHVIQPDLAALQNGKVAVHKFYHDRLALAAVMYYNNEFNLSFNPSTIAESVHDHDALFHCDCVQAAGYAKLDVEEFQCDSMSISSHKIYGPKGVGALYVRDKSKLSPIICGSSQQEYGLRGGTENVAGIVGFGKACELAEKELEHRKSVIDVLTSEFRSRLDKIAMQHHIDDRLHFNMDGLKGKNISVRFDGVDAQTLLMAMENYDVIASAGSACHGKSTEPSRVLKAIGLSDEQAHNTMRISVSSKNTVSEMEKAAQAIVECAVMLLEGGF